MPARGHLALNDNHYTTNFQHKWFYKIQKQKYQDAICVVTISSQTSDD